MILDEKCRNSIGKSNLLQWSAFMLLNDNVKNVMLINDDAKLRA